jgi:glycosyltransferase involved in cell wall biosynthesis
MSRPAGIALDYCPASRVMKISVIIPAYNASATIAATIESALDQTRPADEILVMDDGSTDDTFARLSAYGSRIKVYRQSNQGVSASRNFLCRAAGGDVMAFLDSDDAWHPDYLKTQQEMLSRHPDAAASFTGFLDSDQFAKNSWGSLSSDCLPVVKVMDRVQFFKRYNYSTTQFPPSACCVLKSLLHQMGDEPFPVKFRMAEDFWFMNVIPLLGKPVIYNSTPLAMYRLSPGSLSADRLKIMEPIIRVCEILTRRYEAEASPELWRTLREVFPSKRRNFSKFLMGAGRFSEARHQIKASIRETGNLKSIVKSFGLLAASHLPSGLQPKWPGQFRQQ